jgi:metal-dependent amidase/aminoacylase/carboxypeptidase family protein
MTFKALEMPDILKTTKKKIVADSGPSVVASEVLHRKLHSNPELSPRVEASATVVSDHLRSLKNIKVRTNVGGHGSGDAWERDRKTVGFRAHMNALPIQEQTGLDYSSTKRMVDVANNIEKPVMHARGYG